MKHCDFNVEFEYEGPTMCNLYKVTSSFPSKELPSVTPPFPKEEE
jgi:hypothetical protein